MKMFRPMAVDDSVLASSTVPEETSPSWLAGTTYTLGDRVRIESSYTHTIYQSIQSSNTGKNPATETDWWAYVSDTYAEWDAGTTYALGDIVIDLATHHEWESIQSANTGHALTNTSWWLDRGLNNRWKMFGASIGGQTTQAEQIEIVLNTTGRNDSVALLNIVATTVSISMRDATDGVVYGPDDVSLLAGSGVTDWWKYFFEPIVWMDNYALISSTAMPLYANVEVTITLKNPGGVAKCGVCIVGLSKEIGKTQYGAEVGIEDYSVKSTDQFGETSVIERAYANTGDFTIFVDNNQVDELKRALAGYRATPIFWIGSEQYNSTWVYGFFSDFAVEISYPTASIVSLHVKGLT